MSQVSATARVMTTMPQQIRKPLTWDRGMELADPKNVTTQTGMDVYFADPRRPWQRGTNENDRLLRQYLPKGVSMGGPSHTDLDMIAARLNNRPRKDLYDTPAERLTVLCGDPAPG